MAVGKANEGTAFAAIKLINVLEKEHFEAHPANGFECSLASLDNETIPPSMWIKRTLSTGQTSGYTLHLACGPKTTASGVDFYPHYTITAVPTWFRMTGYRGFCSNETSEIGFDPQGGTNCNDFMQ